MTDIKHWIKTHVWLLILIAIVVGFAFPNQGLILKPYLIYLLMALMFLSCLSINLKEIFNELKDFRDELWTLAIIHLCSPLIILLLKPLFSEEIFLGLILASVISSGMSVVFLSHLYGGVASEALVITSISNMLSPLLVPMLVLLFAKTSIQIDIIAMAFTILKLVIIPLVLATLIRKTKFCNKLKSNCDYVSIALLFLIIIGIIAPVREVILGNIMQAIGVGALIAGLVSINFFLGYFIDKKKKTKITYALTASYKNFTLATVIALSMFNPVVALPAIMYTVVNNLFLIPLQLIFVKEKKN